MKHTIKYVFCFLIGWITTMTTGCDPNALSKDFTAAVTTVQDDKDLVEGIVHDLKSEPSRNPSPRFTALQTEYDDARAAQAAYLASVKLAVAERNNHAQLDPTADQAELKANQFLQDAANYLLHASQISSTSNSRHANAAQSQDAVSIGHVINMPRSVHRSILKASKTVRQDVLRDFERQVQWRSWDQL